MSFDSVLVPVDDMAAAIRFLSVQLGISPRFQDGERYASFPQMTLSLGLLGAEERVASETSLGIRVEDLAATLEKWAAAGAETLRPQEKGPHELRAVVRIPGGMILTLVQKIDA